MEPLLFGVGALAVLGLIVLVASRNRRDAALAPTRLGPSWQPQTDGEEVADPDVRARRVQDVVARTDAEEATVAAVLDTWDEYLGVLGLAPLPAGRRRQVYDPYDPPVATRGSDGRPEPDHQRVARDVASRLGIDETVALRVIVADTGGADDA